MIVFLQIYQVQNMLIVAMEKLPLLNHKELNLTGMLALKRIQTTVNSHNLELVFFVERRVPRFV